MVHTQTHPTRFPSIAKSITMSEPSNEPPSLMLLAEKLLSRPVKADLLAYCPTMDLLALATSEERVYVYRLNGQRVIGSGNKNQRLEVRKIQWKPNGAVRLLVRGLE